MGYIDAEMSLIQEEKMAGYDHIFSKKFKRKMKKMFWSEKYFDKHIYFGYAVRKIAMVFIVIVGLFMANEVSARVFGFNPWKYFISFLEDSKMDVRVYDGQRTEEIEKQKVLEAQKEIPSMKINGLEEKIKERDDNGLYVEWTDGKDGIQYERTKLSEGMTIATDGEYESKETLGVAGYQAQYYKKGKEEWIIWDDKSYRYMIVATNIKEAKKELLSMARDIYR